MVAAVDAAQTAREFVVRSEAIAQTSISAIPAHALLVGVRFLQDVARRTTIVRDHCYIVTSAASVAILLTSIAVVKPILIAPKGRGVTVLEFAWIVL